MKRTGITPISELIPDYLDNLGLSDTFRERQIIEEFKSMSNGFFNKYLSNIYVKSGVLYIKLSNSILREELVMSKAKLVEKLNAAVSPDSQVIKDIVLL